MYAIRSYYAAQAGDGLAARAVDIRDPAGLAGAFAALETIDHLVITAGARVGSSQLSQLQADELQLGFETKLFGALFRITSYNVCYTKLLRAARNCRSCPATGTRA